MKLSKKERRERTEKKRQDIVTQILKHMDETAQTKFSTDGKVNLNKWLEDGDRFVGSLLKKTPQDGELIRSAAIRVMNILKKGLDAYHEAKEKK